MNKKFVLAIICLGAAMQPMAAQDSRNALRDSLKVAVEALSYHPDSINLLLKKAGWNMQLDQWQYAKDEYDKVLQLQPGNVAGLYYRAYANERLHRYNFARLDYENLLDIIPGNFEAQLGLALLNQKDKHFTEALDGINRLVTAFPDSSLAWAARGGIEKEQGMLELAEYDYEEALVRDKGNTDYLLNLTDIQIRLRKYDNAKRNLDAIVKQGTPKMALKDWYNLCR